MVLVKDLPPCPTENLPDLYPIVIPPFYWRPFECFGEGLRYRGPQGLRYARDCLLNIQALLQCEGEEDDAEEADEEETLVEGKQHKKNFKKVRFKKLKSPDSRTGIFWNAQLRLFGLDSQPAKPHILRKQFKDAIANGLRSPTDRLLQLERQLNCQFLLENAQERDKQYEALTDTTKKVLLFPKRFFREFFAEGTDALFILQRQLPWEVQEAAEVLGLHYTCTTVQSELWTIVGRDVTGVRDRIQKIQSEQDDGRRNGKRQKVEDTREKRKQKSMLQDLEDEQETFKKLNVAQMDRLWRTLEDNKKLELYPTRFLSEHFFSEGRENFVQVFKENQTEKRRSEIRTAAELLGLRVAIAENVPGEYNEKWTVIGRSSTAVEECRRRIEAERYEKLDEIDKFERFPTRFLREELVEGENGLKDRVVLFRIESVPELPHAKYLEKVLKQAANGNEKLVILKNHPEQRLIDPAKSLELLIQTNVGGGRWIIIGRDSAFVRECLQKAMRETEKTEKQRVEEQVEVLRKELEGDAVPTSELRFEDVKGEWTIECDGVQWNDDLFSDSDDIYDEARECCESQNAVPYEEALKKMSIFFYSVTGGVDFKSVNGEVGKPPDRPASTLRLCANFYMGLFGGLLRSTSDSPSSLSFPSEEIAFTFKGWDESNGEPFDLAREPREGSLTFESRTQLKGIMRSMYGVMKFVARKMSNYPNVQCYDWDELPPPE